VLGLSEKDSSDLATMFCAERFVVYVSNSLVVPGDVSNINFSDKGRAGI